MKRKAYATMGVIGCLALSIGSVGARAEEDGYTEPRSHRHLSGDYGFTSTQTCVRTPFQRPPAAGFDPVTRQLLVDAETVDAVSMGVMNFERDGTVSIRNGVLTEILVDQLAAGQNPVAPGAEFSCSGTYTLGVENKVSVTLSCDVVSRQPGVSITLGPLSFEGFVGVRKESINLSLVEADIQTVLVSVGGAVVQERQRICTQSASLVKM